MWRLVAEKLSEIILWALVLACSGYGSYITLEKMAFVAAERMDKGFSSLEDLSKRLSLEP